IPSDCAALLARSMSRDAIATTSACSARCSAGITWTVAIRAVPNTPQRTFTIGRMICEVTYPQEMPSFVFLPPQTDTTRQWAAALAQQVPELDVVIADSPETAAQLLPHADAAFGTLTPDLLSTARGLAWLQAPAIAPPAGYYYPELVQHPVVVT